MYIVVMVFLAQVSHDENAPLPQPSALAGHFRDKKKNIEKSYSLYVLV
jgi:hypothetical protein